MELMQVGEKTYYIKNPTNIGIYKLNDTDIYLIDSGNDKEAGKKILKIVEEKGWKVVGIINTHSNADHIGGNKVIQDRTNCLILGNETEVAFNNYPLLEPSFLYGGYPLKELQNKFLMAKPSKASNIENLPEGLEYFNLKGHFFDMIGIKTSDDVYFLGDSLFSENTINKYHFFFIYDVLEYLNTLDYLETLEGKLYIPSHVEATKDIKDIININRKKLEEICSFLISICNNKTFEQILKEVFDHYQLNLDINQYVLVGSTIKSYLTYLCNQDKLTYRFENNQMIWYTI